MSKINKLIAPSLLLMTALTACGGGGGNSTTSERVTIEFWTQFGADGLTVVNGLLEDFQKDPRYNHITVNHSTKNGYDNLKTAIDNSIASGTYPHVANGYPDHFASYIKTRIQTPLNSYIDKLENKEEFLDDFYPDYMAENINMVKDKIVALPWNKSTEFMFVNKGYFDVMNSYDNTIKVPETWEEVEAVGTKVLQLNKEKALYGKVVVKDPNGGYKTVTRSTLEGQALIDFNKTVMFDFSDVNEGNFRLFSWDSLSNMFITLTRQWGATYTSSDGDISKGKIKFHNDPLVIDMLTTMQNLFKKGIVGIPTIWDESFASKPFQNSKVVLTVSSTAGTKQNIPTGYVTHPFEYDIAALPFKTEDKKYVISQGTNLALFNQGTAAQREAGFELIKYLTTERNDQFAINASYFPVTKTMQNSTLYQEFLNPVDVSQMSQSEQGVRKTSLFNDQVYMQPENKWIKFTDPAFVGSTDIRKAVDNIFTLLFVQGVTPEKALQDTIANIDATFK